ncbi:hypothetical protein BP5796_01709 [Coleophoma crateriformis]|uniref:POPLD-domain-containing protein n=1 Tax=Coleophoma crateriformis TaxID=565419 RepID=A0A3D8T168_9HELO|nr:hypothetical protein BP5796_01709 [Coleophoma crateriformis]
MPAKLAASAPNGSSNPQKRKASSVLPSRPQNSFSSGRGRGGYASKRQKLGDARTIASQASDAALSNGELDLQAFLKAREFEIKALEKNMQNAKSMRNERAHQQVPRDMRRRTASHNVKRVPKRMRTRAEREMKDDNTPTVSARTRKPGSSRARLRAETAKRLESLAAKKKAARQTQGETARDHGIETRAARPKIRTDKLNDPSKPKAKFRKRQINKTWLPTHMWHAKRATMTEPKNPLWRFAMPLTSTEKSYRPTHRASGGRGAIAWDTSYMSTIRLHGPAGNLEKVLRGLGLIKEDLWGPQGENWRQGKRSWSGWLSRSDKGAQTRIGPATAIWSSVRPHTRVEGDLGKSEKPGSSQSIFLRVHPAIFLEAWNEVLRLSKQQRPAVHAEDLRFEIGSIEITGPASTETLLGILHPFEDKGGSIEKHGSIFSSLAGVSNPASLPVNSLLSFSIQDPRLRYPSRTIALPDPADDNAGFELLQILADWPADTSPASTDLYDRDSRFRATHLSSQKAINRRKALAPPGAYPSISATDPRIPVMLLASRSNTVTSSQGSWTVLAPWKCILPIWYGIVHYPLSTGGNPRFGGLNEIRQVHFEHGVPWFPADFPGTSGGYTWEINEREKRKSEWDKRPKGKRIEWGSLNLGAGRKGEIGRGWACDFEWLLRASDTQMKKPVIDSNATTQTTEESTQTHDINETANISPTLQHLPSHVFKPFLSPSMTSELPANNTVATVRITLISRGLATPCARIYRLPSLTTLQSSAYSACTRLPSNLREQWLSLLPSTSTKAVNSKSKKNSKITATRIPLNTPLQQRVRLLAQSLLKTPPLPYPKPDDAGDHPLCPDEEDCIGFVTTGEFNLAEGKGIAIGSLLARKVVEGLRAEIGGGQEGKLCIVRNAGETVGRLARWEVV